jgi:hypothetical protein
MSLAELIRTGQLQYVTLWALAITSFALAVTNTPVLGFGPSSLLLMATVFAAVTAEYNGHNRCGETSTTS